jgi:hypothetical protein
VTIEFKSRERSVLPLLISVTKVSPQLRKKLIFGLHKRNKKKSSLWFWPDYRFGAVFEALAPKRFGNFLESNASTESDYLSFANPIEEFY